MGLLGGGFGSLSRRSPFGSILGGGIHDIFGGMNNIFGNGSSFTQTSFTSSSIGGNGNEVRSTSTTTRYLTWFQNTPFFSIYSEVFDVSFTFRVPFFFWNRIVNGQKVTTTRRVMNDGTTTEQVVRETLASNRRPNSNRTNTDIITID